MSKKKVCVCGHFGFGHNLLNGQTIKTKVITSALEQALGADEVQKTDTSGGIKALLRLPFTVGLSMKATDNLLILPAYKGIRFLAVVITFWKLFLRHCTIHYAVVGAWLPEYVRTKPIFRFFLRRSVDIIYSETSTMKQQLAVYGFHNVYIMPNCKPLHILSEGDLQLTHSEPFRLCTFSRVMKMKGLAEAADVVQRINAKEGRTVFTLDIYGPVWPAEQEWFDEVQKTFTPAVRYCGAVDFEHSVDILKEYFLLLFPTRFATEGVPGTLIDAYASGLPVLSARWYSFADVVEEGVTGWGYTLDDWEDLTLRLQEIAKKPSTIESMRIHCLEKAQGMVPEIVAKTLIERLT